jgi:hypothetical protein
MTTAMVVRGGCGVARLDGEDFAVVFFLVPGFFAMLSQYTANASVETRLAASPTADSSKQVAEKSFLSESHALSG